MSHIRCKLRCKSIDDRHDKLAVQFMAVTDGGDDDENKIFSKYTPSAELTLNFPKGTELPWKSNETWYLDMERLGPCAEGGGDLDWNDSSVWVQTWGIILSGPESREYKWHRYAWQNGERGRGVPPYNSSFKMHVDNPNCWPALGLSGDIGWKFVLRKAPEVRWLHLNNEWRPIKEKGAFMPITFDQLLEALGHMTDQPDPLVWFRLHERDEPTPVTREGFVLQAYGYYDLGGK